MWYRIVDGGQMLARVEAENEGQAMLKAIDMNEGDVAAQELIRRGWVEKEHE